MEGNTFLYAILSIAMQLALKGSLVFAALVKPDYEFAILSSVIAMISMVVVFLFFAGRTLFPSRKTYSIAEIRSLKKFFIYSLYTWPVPILLYFNILATLIIIRVKLGNDAVGIFTSVSVFVGVITVLQAGFSTFWSGYMFENYKTQVLRITRMHDYMSFFIIVLMACFVLFRDVIFLLLGAKYQVSKPFFALLLLYPLLLILSETTCYGISIAKKTELLLIVTFLSILLNLGIIWMLIPSWGLIGACIGSAVSAFVFFAVQSYFAQKYYRSIEHAGRTVFTVFSVVVLAVGNQIFNNSFGGLTALSMTGLLFAGLVYRKQIFQIKSFLLDIMVPEF
jgi:O-antigen/teichoic acid export membrane protein